MPTIPVKEYGRGRVTAQSQTLCPLGSALDSLNFLHNRGRDTAELRAFIDRVWATRPAAATALWKFEYVKSDMTKLFLVKQGSVLYSAADLTPTTTLASILTGMDATHLPSGVNANGYVFLADWGVKNYIIGGTSATTYELQKAAPTGSLGGSGGGTATGNLAGTIYFCYTDVTPEGVESPPTSAGSFSRTADQGSTYSNVTLTFTAPYTTKNVYQTTAGSTQFYKIASGITAANFAATLTPYTTLDTALAVPANLSTVHDTDSTAASIEKPEAAKHACWHRGRLFLANLGSALPSRIRWSRPLEPTQFESFTTARFDVGKLDGGEITGLVSFRGSLVVFKTNSIWVLNGDVDEDNFVFSEIVPGIGCVAPRTIVRYGDDRIFFLSAHGVMSFDLSTVKELSGDNKDEIRALAYTSYANFFCAGCAPRNRLYCLAVTPTGSTTNTKIYVFNADTGAWGRFLFGMGKIVPTCFTDTCEGGPVRNANGNIALYMGDANGYFYELDAATSGDGVTSGDTSGTVTSVTGTTVTTCSAAVFRTTGDTLKGLPLTLRRAADSSYETVEITSNTSTAVTHGAWVGTVPVAGDTVFVGAIQGTLSLNATDLKTNRRKRWGRIEVQYKKQTHAIPLRVGYTIDDGSVPTATTEGGMNAGYFMRRSVNRRSSVMGIYLDIIGTACPVELTGLLFEVEVLAARLPTR